jgi:hypothetical protein
LLTYRCKYLLSWFLSGLNSQSRCAYYVRTQDQVPLPSISGRKWTSDFFLWCSRQEKHLIQANQDEVVGSTNLQLHQLPCCPRKCVQTDARTKTESFEHGRPVATTLLRYVCSRTCLPVGGHSCSEAPSSISCGLLWRLLAGHGSQVSTTRMPPTHVGEAIAS